jgi:hypothetical protein
MILRYRLRRKWCTENFMKINVVKINIISFALPTNSIHFNYIMGNLLIVRNDCLTDFGVMLDSKLFGVSCWLLTFWSTKAARTNAFHRIQFYFSWESECFIALIRSRLLYAPVAWNNLALGDPNKLEDTRIKFVNLFYNRFSQSSSLWYYEPILYYLQFKRFIPDDKILALYFLVTFQEHSTVALQLCRRR